MLNIIFYHYWRLIGYLLYTFFFLFCKGSKKRTVPHMGSIIILPIYIQGKRQESINMNYGLFYMYKCATINRGWIIKSRWHRIITNLYKEIRHHITEKKPCCTDLPFYPCGLYIYTRIHNYIIYIILYMHKKILNINCEKMQYSLIRISKRKIPMRLK